MGDVDDRGPAPGGRAHQFEHGRHAVRAQRGGRLVEDEDARIGGDGLGQLQELALGHGQVLQARPQRHTQVHAPQLLAHPLGGRLDPGGGQRQVLGHGEVGQHRRVLVDDGQAMALGLRGCDAIVLCSPMRIEPSSGAIDPEATDMRVDLPAPFSPRTAWTSPARQ